MKTVVVSLLLGLYQLTAMAQVKPADLVGAWQFIAPSGTRTVLTFTDNYVMHTAYEPDRFISTSGGTWQLAGNNLIEIVEFNAADSTRVGSVDRMGVSLTNKKLTVATRSGKMIFDRIDQFNSPEQLAGLWRITSRANDAGQLTPMQRGPRKTLKLLTGTRFQWVAINPQTKQFSGTGGGTYTLKDGKYTETIEFFSRDNSRVGKLLTFGAEVGPTEWHHTGQSSTGGPVNEIWTRETGN